MNNNREGVYYLLYLSGSTSAKTMKLAVLKKGMKTGKTGIQKKARSSSPQQPLKKQNSMRTSVSNKASSSRSVFTAPSSKFVSITSAAVRAQRKSKSAIAQAAAALKRNKASVKLGKEKLKIIPMKKAKTSSPVDKKIEKTK